MNQSSAGVHLLKKLIYDLIFCTNRYTIPFSSNDFFIIENNFKTSIAKTHATIVYSAQSSA